jgi:DNA-directed RNA polymerase subunit H
MHILQSKHIKLTREEAKKILDKYNISLSQLPKVKREDSAVPENSESGDILKIEREHEGKTEIYYRVVV